VQPFCLQGILITERVSKLLSTLKGLPPAAVVRLVGWKLRERIRHAADRSGGSERLARRGDAFARQWLHEHGDAGIGPWLSRPGAGVFWFEPDARTWARESCTPADLELAERAAAGGLPLLGTHTGPGARPEWRRDLYSGIEWPLEPSSRLRILREDGSDIRTVWELSRCYHFLPLARACAHAGANSATGTRHADTFALHVTSFMEENPLGYGPHWASPMDVALRAANWALAVPLFADAPLPPALWAGMLGNLWASGHFIERNLEWHPVHRGNHYVANLVGLVYLGTLFRSTRAGDRWLRTGSRELQRELACQVHDDGVSFEASLAYHRLVTELFGWAGELLRRNEPSFDATSYDAKLRRMSAFIGVYLQPDGRAPMIGDADDGRVHAVHAGSMAEPRRHDLGLPPRYPVEPVGDGVFSSVAGGFHVLRHGRHHAVVRCGALGLAGAGSHDHNDQLGFELVVAGRRFVGDSGTFVYSRDLDARHAFRATAAHSVVQIGEEEQNPIVRDRPWRMLEDRTRSRCTACEANGGRLLFAGEHHGFAHLPSAPVCRRELSLDVASGTWNLDDEIAGERGVVPLTWRLHIEALEVHASDAAPGRVRVLCPGDPDVAVELSFPTSLTFDVRPARASDAYGLDRERRMLVLSGDAEVPIRIQCRIRQEQQ
jgi:hypothetical protein